MRWAADDLILPDRQMPEVDGDEAAAATRFLTASATAEGRQRCLGAGTDHCLAKPFAPAALAAALARVWT